MATFTSKVTLNDGVVMPTFGLGVYDAQAGGEAYSAVKFAIQNGYRLIDTAAEYGNEQDIGKAVNDCGVNREELFVTTKLWNSDHGYEATKKALKDSLKRLNLDYIDLYLIHSPIGGKLVETYDAMLEWKKAGLIRSVGVSNFNVHHIKGLTDAGRPLPSVNQIELNPFMLQQDVVDYCLAKKVAVEGYCPVAKMRKADDPLLVSLSTKYRKTVAQVMIRWSVQKKYITIPKSSKPERILENKDVFDFFIEDGDMRALEKLPDYRCAWNPLIEPWQG